MASETVKSKTGHFLDRLVRALTRDLEKAEGALKVIYTWATFRDGEALVPKHVADICARSLRERPNYDALSGSAGRKGASQ